jgi:hypothetical protein
MLAEWPLLVEDLKLEGSLHSSHARGDASLRRSDCAHCDPAPVSRTRSPAGQ